MFTETSPLIGPQANSGPKASLGFPASQHATGTPFAGYYGDGQLLYQTTSPGPHSAPGTPLIVPPRRFFATATSRLYVLSSVSFVAGLGLLLTGFLNVPNALRFRWAGAACLSMWVGLRCAANRTMPAPPASQSPTV